MRLFSTASAVAEEALKADSAEERIQDLKPLVEPLGRRRTRQKMASTGVLQMKSEQLDSFFNGNNESNKQNEKQMGELMQRRKMPLETHDEISEEEEDAFLPDADDASINSDVSDESVEIRPKNSSIDETYQEVPFGEKVRNLIRHERYSSMSAIFGTIMVFFFLSVRIEYLLIDTCSFTDHQNTWDFIPNRTTAFWLTVAWFSIFIIESTVTCFLFGRRQTSDFNAVRFTAACLDLILTCTCYGLFLWAEAQRCCDCDGPSIAHKAGAEYPKKDNCQSLYYDNKCCPSFGSRLCGGVGNIEPYACLIALRLLRFRFARILVSVKRVMSKTEGDELATSQVGSKTDNEKHVETTHGHGGKANFDVQSGTIAELWILALNEYPEIVEEHGIFSGLLLESMLGIKPLPHEAQTAKEEPKVDLDQGLSGIETIDVKPKPNLNVSALSFPGAAGSSIVDLNVPGHNFLRPTSPLIRSMRRCECDWKWLKSSSDSSWEVVDVVLTDFEIVWFDAMSSPRFHDLAERDRIQSVKEQIIAKNGGKGLRLSDVALGRNVLGRLALADVDHIRVHRIAPSSEQDDFDEGTLDRFLDLEGNMDTSPSGKIISKEYWNDFGDHESLQLPLEKQWRAITEDRLRLHSSQGTLFLRFFVDLYNEVRPNLAEEGLEKKQGALLWCDNISHLCRKSQLKQKSSFFVGDNRKSVLQDYIVHTGNRSTNDSGLGKSMMWNLRNSKKFPDKRMSMLLLGGKRSKRQLLNQSELQLDCPP